MTLVPKDDLMGQLIFNQADPAVTLAKVRGMDGHVTYVQVAVSGRPIDYLHKRIPNAKSRISDAQFFAAERYLGDYTNTARMGSNTASTINLLNQQKKPWTSAQADEMRSGRMIPLAKPWMPLADHSESIVDAAFKLKNVNEALSDLDRMLLQELVIKEYPIGIISQKLGMNPDAVGVLVRAALWSLASIYRRLDPEYRTWCENEMRLQDHGDGEQPTQLPTPERKRPKKSSDRKANK